MSNTNVIFVAKKNEKMGIKTKEKLFVLTLVIISMTIAIPSWAVTTLLIFLGCGGRSIANSEILSIRT